MTISDEAYKNYKERIALEKNIFADRHAYVLFSGETELKRLFWLRRGFKHCSVIITDGKHCMLIDPLSHQTEVTAHFGVRDFDWWKQWLADQGYIVLECPIYRAPRSVLPIGWVSCVEICKRILGIRKWWIWTPYQLYRHLIALEQEDEAIWTGWKKVLAIRQ